MEKKTQKDVCFFSTMENAVLRFTGNACKLDHSVALQMMESHFVINVVSNWGSKQWPYSLHGLRCVKWCILQEKVREFCMGRICVTVGLEAMHKYDFEIRFWFNLIMTFSDVALNFFFFFWCGMLNSLLLSNWQQQKKNVVFFIFHFSIMCSD